MLFDGLKHEFDAYMSELGEPTNTSEFRGTNKYKQKRARRDLEKKEKTMNSENVPVAVVVDNLHQAIVLRVERKLDAPARQLVLHTLRVEKA